MNQQNQLRISPAWLALGGFVLGLILFYQVAGMFGLPAHLVWPFITIAFVVMVFFLRRPKLFLFVLMFYSGFFFNGNFLGRIPLPLPGIRVLDDFLLVIPIAMIIMKATTRDLPRGATVFPFVYLFLSVLSWRINHVPTMNFIRATLAFSKFYIVWYFVRSLGPWSEKEIKRWLVFFLGFAVIQCLANFGWQQHVILRYHPDYSIGTLGGAHHVGYLSCMVLFMMLGYLMSLLWEQRLTGRRLFWLGVVSILILYNLVFLTDTKHVLFLAPLAVVPFFLLKQKNTKMRWAIVLSVLIFGLFSWVYLTFIYAGSGIFSMDLYLYSFKVSGKRAMINVLAYDLPRQLPVPVLGAGPGNFNSAVGLMSLRPLAVRYLLQHIMASLRPGVGSVEGSVIGSPITDVFTLLGEYGVLNTMAYLGFWVFAIWTLWRKAKQPNISPLYCGQMLAACSCLLLLLQLMFLVDVVQYMPLMFPAWAMAGMVWDYKPEEAVPPVLSAKPARALSGIRRMGFE